MPNLIAFRTDACHEIGHGHLMRCLTLANRFRELGDECHFICRFGPGADFSERIVSSGHCCHKLPGNHQSGYGSHPNPPAHANWLALGWHEDATATTNILAELKADWLVVDHYALEAEWEKLVRSEVKNVAVIDDLADRCHSANVLLDQNFGRQPKDYQQFVSGDCTVLAGTRYALLRSEFSKLRSEAIHRRKTADTDRILITVGGVDQQNAAGQILEALNQVELPNTANITVVLGENAPHSSALRSRAALMPRDTNVLTNVKKMGELMRDSDLCIGAAGGTTWERCALGLPTMLVVLADNQSPAAEALIGAGVCLALPPVGSPEMPRALKKGIETLADPMRYAEFVSKSTEIVDGLGANRVVAHIKAHGITFREAHSGDAEKVWEWRHADEAWRYYKSGAPTPLPDHIVWFEKALKAGSPKILIAQVQQEDAGYVRFDFCKRDAGRAEISLCLSEQTRGRGVGVSLIAAGLVEAGRMGIKQLNAKVHRENGRSAGVFLQNGFQMSESGGDFLEFGLMEV